MQNKKRHLNKMLRIIFLSLLISFSFVGFGQIENRWQPDTVYKNRKVKKIFVYMNSPKDLSEIVEFDKKGKRIRVEKYSASYNKKTRRSKRLDLITYSQFDSNEKLIRIVDSTIHYSNSISVNYVIFEYSSDGLLICSKKFKGSFKNPNSITEYFYNPYKSTTTRRNDSIITYQKTMEYDKDFYVNHFYGYYLDPKLIRIKSTVNGVTNIVAYSDYSDLKMYEDNKVIDNKFDEYGRLETSYIKSVFMNDRVNEFQLTYNYYKNGLLKSIRGYVPRYFKYEFYE